jgi:hypothetical protein
MLQGIWVLQLDAGAVTGYVAKLLGGSQEVLALGPEPSFLMGGREAMGQEGKQDMK